MAAVDEDVVGVLDGCGVAGVVPDVVAGVLVPVGRGVGPRPVWILTAAPAARWKVPRWYTCAEVSRSVQPHQRSPGGVDVRFPCRRCAAALIADLRHAIGGEYLRGARLLRDRQRRHTLFGL